MSAATRLETKGDGAAARVLRSEAYRFKKMARLCADRSRVLDLGCACAPNTHLRNPEVIGLDQTRVAAPENYREMVVGDVRDLPQPFGAASFDCVVAGELLEHLERPLDFLRGCAETLQPGGLLILSTPNPNSPMERLLTLNLSRRYFYTSAHVCIYPQRWLIRMMEIAGFGDVELFSGGLPFPGLGLVPFPRPWCYQTIGTARKA